MRTLGVIAFVWFAISIPTALILGRVLRNRSAQYPTSDELDERAALHVVKGEQR